MKNRNWSCKACILSLHELASSHKLAKILIQEEGETSVLEATLFGGAKSKLAGFVLPYYTGTLYLYSNPIKDAHKIMDFNVEKMRFGIRESLTRIWTSAFAGEVCIKMSGIDWQLINAFFDGINIAKDAECKLALLRFIWRLANFSGLAPHFYGCSSCKKTELEELYFDHASGEFFCSSCTFNKGSSSLLIAEALNYLYKVQNYPPKVSRTMQVSNEAISLLATFLFRFITSIVGSDLYSLSPQNPLYRAVQF